jgi:putative sterol carrier protein
MAAFRDITHAAEVLGGFFRQEAEIDDKIFAGSGIVIAYNLHDPDVRLVLDGRKTPEPGSAYLVYVNDPAAPQPNTEFTTDADSFDKIYRGEAQAMMMLMSGKVKTKGDLTGAMRLLPAMARIIPHYREYRKTHE